MTGKSVRGSVNALDRAKTGVQSKENLDISNSSHGNEAALIKGPPMVK